MGKQIKNKTKLDSCDSSSQGGSRLLNFWRKILCSLFASSNNEHAHFDCNSCVRSDVKVIVIDTLSQTLLRDIISRHVNIIKVPERAVKKSQQDVSIFMRGVVDGGVIALDLSTANQAEIQAAVCLCLVRHIPFLAFRGDASPFLKCFATVYYVPTEEKLSAGIVEIAEKGHRQRAPFASPVGNIDLPITDLQSQQSKFAVEQFIQRVLRGKYKGLRPPPRFIRLQAFAIQTPAGYEKQKEV